MKSLLKIISIATRRKVDNPAWRIGAAGCLNTFSESTITFAFTILSHVDKEHLCPIDSNKFCSEIYLNI